MPLTCTPPWEHGDTMTTFIITAIILLVVVLLCWAAMMRPGRG
jgi:hypothetical protein